MIFKKIYGVWEYSLADYIWHKKRQNFKKMEKIVSFKTFYASNDNIGDYSGGEVYIGFLVCIPEGKQPIGSQGGDGKII